MSDQQSVGGEYGRSYHAFHALKELLILSVIAGVAMITVARYDPHPLQAAFGAVIAWEIVVRDHFKEYAVNGVGVIIPTKAEGVRDEL